MAKLIDHFLERPPLDPAWLAFIFRISSKACSFMVSLLFCQASFRDPWEGPEVSDRWITVSGDWLLFGLTVSSLAVD